MALSKITNEKREILKQKSAQSLPDVPSLQNWSPKQFKNAITKVLFDNKDSFFAYFNTLTEELEEQFLTKEDEKVFLFKDTTFDLLDNFAQACHNVGYQKIYFGKVIINNEEVDAIGLRNSDDSVTIITGSGHIYKYNSDGTQETITIPNIEVTNIKVNSNLILSGIFKAISTTFNGNTTFVGLTNFENSDLTIKEPTLDNNPATKKYSDANFVKAQEYTNQQILKHTNEILGGVGESGDTLKELFDLIINNKGILEILQDAIVKTTFDKETTEITQILERNFDYSFSAEGISIVTLSIPENITQGYMSGFSIKIGEEKPIIEFYNASSYNMLFTLNGMQRKKEQLFFKSNQTLNGAAMCDGINVYVYLKEIQQESELD